MISAEYRAIIARMAFNMLKRQFPGANKNDMQLLCKRLAINIHARMYGANVDGVDSPIWRERQCGDKAEQPPPNQPKVDAAGILKQEEDK